MCTKNMMRKGMSFWVALIVLGSCTVSSAGVRVWRDKSGNSFVGEFVREKFEKFYFKDTEKQVVNVGVDEISDADLKYIRNMLPPKIGIKIKKEKEDIELLPYAVTGEMKENIEDITFTVSVRKKSKPTFDGTLRGELYVVGEELASDHYRMLLKDVFPIKFGESGECAFSDTARARNYLEYTGIEMRGNEYMGYALFIFGPSGELMEVDTDLPFLKEDDKVESFRKLKTGCFFKDNMRASSTPRPKRTEYLGY